MQWSPRHHSIFKKGFQNVWSGYQYNYPPFHLHVHQCMVRGHQSSSVIGYLNHSNMLYQCVFYNLYNGSRTFLLLVPDVLPPLPRIVPRFSNKTFRVSSQTSDLRICRSFFLNFNKVTKLISYLLQ